MSCRLLGAAELRLLRALGVFSGGFALDLAVALMTDEAQARWDVIDGLATVAAGAAVGPTAGVNGCCGLAKAFSS